METDTKLKEIREKLSKGFSQRFTCEQTLDPRLGNFYGEPTKEYILERIKLEGIKLEVVSTLLGLVDDGKYYTLKIEPFNHERRGFLEAGTVGYVVEIREVESIQQRRFEMPPFTALDNFYKKGVSSWWSIGQAIAARIKADLKQLADDIGFKP